MINVGEVCEACKKDFATVRVATEEGPAQVCESCAGLVELMRKVLGLKRIKRGPALSMIRGSVE